MLGHVHNILCNDNLTVTAFAPTAAKLFFIESLNLIFCSLHEKRQYNYRNDRENLCFSKDKNRLQQL